MKQADNPIAVVQGQPLAGGDDGHGPVDAQSAAGQQRVDIGAVLGDGALLSRLRSGRR